MKRIGYFILFLFIISCAESVEIIQEVLIRIDRSENLCNSGGTQFNLGQDTNGNKLLEDIEINTSAVFCDDQNDDQIIIFWEDVDKLNGCNGNSGLQVGFVYDWNKDGKFGNGENIDILNICDGIDIENFLFEVIQVNFGGVCGGAHEVRIGTDINENRLLEETEVEKSIYINNREVSAEKTPVNYTLSINDYQDIAQKYININPEAAQSMINFNNFDLLLWKNEEIDIILNNKVTEYGTKVNCQIYNLYYEYWAPGVETGVSTYVYNTDLDVYYRR
jgi:hypothetical protein